MELQLKNIGMIKEANVKLDGLTVIAGENDTGKSTVGKALFFINEFLELFVQKLDYQKLKSDKPMYEEKLEDLQKDLEKMSDLMSDSDEIDIENFSDISKLTASMSRVTTGVSSLTKKMERYLKILELIEKLEDKTDVELVELSRTQKLQSFNSKFRDFFYFELDDNIKFILEDSSRNIGIEKNSIFDKGYSHLIKKPVIFIETPILSNLYSFFSKLDTVQTDIEYKINDYPYTLRSLYKQLKLPLEEESSIDKISILKDIDKTIAGEISIGSSGDLIFKRDGNEHNILSVATGIKTFGIVQMLLNNNYLDKDSILILDEPEVHLHPKWQLEMAKVIVELVKNGVKVLVNSHSPYMIEALELYASKEKINKNFYLSEKEGNYSNITDVSDNVEAIYKKLAEAIETLEIQSLENFKW